MLNRNALVAEQEAEAIEKQTEFNLAKFDKQFSQLQGQTKVATLKSGVELSGTALNNLRYNAEQSKIQKNVIEYNSKVAANKKIEEANFARMQWINSKEQGRQQLLVSYAQAGASLLTHETNG